MQGKYHGITVSWLLRAKALFWYITLLQNLIGDWGVALAVRAYIATINLNIQELRCALLFALTTACGGSWFLEQPSSSLMMEFFRMQWLCTRVPVAWLHFP